MNTRATFFSLSGVGLLALAMATPSQAEDFSPMRPVCADASVGQRTFNIDRSIIINRPTVNNNFDFSKNIEINKSFDFSKNIDLSKNIHIEKNIDLSKKIIINKSLNVEVAAHAQAAAFAGAGARAGAGAVVFAGGGGSTFVNVVNQGGGDIGAVAVEEPCVETWAQVVSSIHAECVDSRGNLHPATRMLRETWVDSSIEKELYRCLPGATLRVVFGEVVQSSLGMAGVYDNGRILTCAPGEALRHFTDGLVKCAAAERVPDCTERENMRRYGTGDLFFSYAARVCAVLAGSTRTTTSSGGYSQASSSIEFSSMSGGVGHSGY